mmetsp:Transcript_4011/g.11335  ORF Transcript_4011/g.11335 Transcript_4011/m.11335 type:complete len:92 (+) Transcript_4011:270-545(+)
MGLRAAASSLGLFPRVLGIVGAGQMGSGIAQVAATCGLDVVLCDTSKAVLESSEAAVLKSLGRMAKSGKIHPEDAEAASRRISRVTELQVV